MNVDLIASTVCFVKIKLLFFIIFVSETKAGVVA